MPRSSTASAVEDGAWPREQAEAKIAFQLRMRARGVRDVNVLRAFERVPRAAFVAQAHGDLAARDIALPIGCGQTMVEPSVLARMVEALAVEPSHRVLELGSGSGYATAILAQLAASVIGLERFRDLAITGQGRLAEFGIANAAILWADGLSAPEEGERFDRIIVHGVLGQLPRFLTQRLTERGVMVYAKMSDGRQEIVQFDAASTSAPRGICASRLQPIGRGLAGALQAVT